MLAKYGVNVIGENEKEKFLNSGENIEILLTSQLIHGFCAASRTKLVSVPEPVEVLSERNNWEDWENYKKIVIRGKLNYLFIVQRFILST